MNKRTINLFKLMIMSTINIYKSDFILKILSFYNKILNLFILNFKHYHIKF